MKVAYVFRHDMSATFQLASMILPQLEGGYHGAEVVGMFFFDENVHVLRAGNPVGERLSRLAARQGMLLMMCDQCALRRNLAEGEFDQCGTGQVRAVNVVDGVVAGCFPQLYQALAGNPPDQVITL